MKNNARPRLWFAYYLGKARSRIGAGTRTHETSSEPQYWLPYCTVLCCMHACQTTRPRFELQLWSVWIYGLFLRREETAAAGCVWCEDFPWRQDRRGLQVMRMKLDGGGKRDRMQWVIGSTIERRWIGRGTNHNSLVIEYLSIKQSHPPVLLWCIRKIYHL